MRHLIGTKVFLIFIVSIFYLLTIKGTVGNLRPNGTGSSLIKTNVPPFETSMERGRYAQTVALADHGDVSVNDFSNFLKPDLAWYAGNFYATFPPGVAALALPLYLIGKLLGLSQVFTFLISVIFTILTSYFIYLTCIRLLLNKWVGVFCSFIFSFGSVAWPYGVSFSAHSASAFLIIVAFYLFLEIKDTKATGLYYAILGFIFGACLFIDYPNLLILLPLVVVSTLLKSLNISKIPEGWDIRFKLYIPVLFFILTLCLVGGGYVLFSLSHYKTPLAFTNTYSIKGFDKVPLSNDMFSKRPYSKRFTPAGMLVGIKTLLFSSDRGLFFFSPIYLLSILGLIIYFKKNKLLIGVLILTVLMNILIYASYDDPWGGWSFGPRYLIVTLPLLAVMCGVGFEYLNYKFGLVSKVITFILLAYSSVVALLGSLTTNAVPPSIEVVKTNISSNYLYNYKYLNTHGVSSFIYSVVLSRSIPAIDYALMVAFLLLVIEFFVVFVKLPRYKKHSA